MSESETFKLREYQTRMIANIHAALARDQRTLAVAATGSGKTVIAATIVGEYLKKGRVMVLAHRDELIQQACRKLYDMGDVVPTVEKADQWSDEENMHGKPPLVVSSIQTQATGRMNRFHPSEFSLVVVDECFPAGTLVEGRPIEQTRVGDMVRTRTGMHKVSHVFKRKPHSLCTIHFQSGAVLTCTPNHPIFTQHGFVPAISLTRGCVVVSIIQKRGVCDSEMLHLRNGNFAPGYESWARQKSEAEVALCQPGVPVGTQPQDYSKNLRDARGGDNLLSQDQRNAPAGSSSAGIDEAPGDGVEADSEGRKRNGADGPSVGTGIRLGLGYGDCHPDQNAAGFRIPIVLQGGYWELGIEGWHRSQWQQPQSECSESSGRQEDGVFIPDWVDYVEFHEPTSGGGFGGLCPDGFVYNIEVEEDHTYFANGVLVHNCHHSIADSWTKVIDHYAANLDCKILGVTATPDRADGEMLGKIFQSVADTYSLTDAVDDGYLVPVRPWSIEIEGLDFSKIHTLAGDFNQGELEEAMMFEEPLHGVAHAMIEIACGLPQDTLRPMLDDPDRRTKLGAILAGRIPKKCLIFCVSVAHAERMAEIIERWIPDSAVVVSGKLADDDRAAYLKLFADGKRRFLVNCMIATEGFDEPSIEMVVMARPTKSRSLYAQMLGRGTRPAENIAHRLGELATAEERTSMIAQSDKAFLGILDFVGNSGRHELVTAVDIFGEGYEDDEISRAKEIAADGETSTMDALEESREELEQKRREAEQRRKDMEERRRRQAMESARQGLVGAANYKINVVNEWDDPPDHISAKHANIFRKAKVPLKDVTGMNDQTRGELCRKIVMHWRMGLCSYRQAKCLRRAGYTVQETECMTFEAASANIDALARNQWRRPQ